MSLFETQEDSPFLRRLHRNNRDDGDEIALPAAAAGGMMPPTVFPGRAPAQASAVHGRGMWNNFLRSFSDPLYALLDLFDNAVDASWNLPKGEVPKIKVDLDTHGQGGIYIRNASSDPIPSMEQILEVFRSAKEHHKSAIGENGVGIKHACANLSDLSLVLTKTADSFSLGILMKDLQQDVPHFPQMVIARSASIYGRIKHMCDLEQMTWGLAVAAYGDGDLYLGIDRICLHFEEMKTGVDWKDASDVFTIVISKLRQTGHTENEGGEEDPESLNDINNDGNGDDSDERSQEVLREFAKRLPQLYIHLNHNIQVQVCGKVIDMAYWETRLADLTLFEVGIPQGREKDAKLKLTHADPPYRHPTVRFWLGFNVGRPSASAHIYYYSRQSGRLIKDLHDCRSMLNLTAGSTDFKQGLTIILDDWNSTLPLNPTKQDLSFAFQEHGETHKTNLNFWLSGITYFFWTYHFDHRNKSKQMLTQVVTKAASLFDGARARKAVIPLNEMDPIRFKNVAWTQRKVKLEDEDGGDASYLKLYVGQQARQSAERTVGRDTLVQLSEVNLRGRQVTKRKASAGPSPSSKIAKTDSLFELEDQKIVAPPVRRPMTARKSVAKTTAVAERQELKRHKELLLAREQEIEEIKREKEEQIMALQKQKEKTEKKVSRLQKELDAARTANGGAMNVSGQLFNVRVMNHENGRSVDLRIPAESNRSLRQVMRDKKVRKQKLLFWGSETTSKLQKKLVTVKVGIWDPTKPEGDYNYVYGLDDLESETTLELFNYIAQDGKNVAQAYDPVHLCMFTEDMKHVKEDEEEFII
ncbi:unnamed protein product [Cylindrotheca closterium]|uniref:Uncharacterized protein n=1 Tax=Cylindrotheca closterium TaxID=2856 RepID=A0AAD2JGK9_9STRA|nr:unnamed protein product [Cylindrotheca closterium]